MEKKFLTVPFASLKSYDDEEDYFHFEGYASTYDNVDRGSDKVVQGAFDNTLKSKRANDIKVYFQHDTMQPLGVVEELRDDKNGLFIRAKMPKEHTKAREVMALMKCGAIDSMSIGYIPVKWDYDDKGVRQLKEIDLYEVSPVTMPMNPRAVITAMKSKKPKANYQEDVSRENDEIDEDYEDAVRATGAKRRKETYEDIQDEEDDLDDEEESLTDREDEIHEEEEDIHEDLEELEDEVEDRERESVRKRKRKKKPSKAKRKKPIVNTREKEEDYEDFNEDWVEDYKPIKSLQSSLKRKKFFIEDVLNISTKREFERCLRDSGAFSGQAAVKLTSYFSDSSDLKKKKLKSQFKVIADLIHKL